MNSKRLIEHTRNLLVQYELARLGIHAQDVKDELFKIADKAKRDLTQPVVVPEEDILTQYLSENKARATLRLFYERTGGRYLQNEYYMFAVFCYLALWRLEELGFAKFSKFVKCFDPVKMSRLIGFIFNPVNLESDLKKTWGTVLDHQFVKEHVIDPILRHVSVGQKLLEELCDDADFGMVAKKSDKKPTGKHTNDLCLQRTCMPWLPMLTIHGGTATCFYTEMEPFVLTKPRQRKLPEPTEKISTIVKANPIPKTLYEDSVEKKRLEIVKEENKRRVMIRDQVEQEQRAKFERERVKSSKTVPHSIHQQVPVKLTTAAILREDALVRKQRRCEEDAIAQAEIMLRDPAEFDAWKEELRIKDEENRLVELERRRLEIQMVHEEAYVARQDKIKENREKAVEVLAAKEENKAVSEAQKRDIDEQNKKKIEEVHVIKEGIIKAKAKVIEDKTQIAAEVIKESQALLEQAQREAEEERARKSELIQQIRLLEKSIPSVGTVQKDVDLTETSGIGLLGEMSIIE
eukprot:jgi/Hompol1/4706/HPOL_002296-RA